MDDELIAIVGMGCRFPGAINIAAYWHLLCNQVDTIAPIPSERQELHSCFLPDSQLPEGGFLEQIDQFDPQFFGISPKEAVSVDPQQRLLLEVTWEALEDASLVPQKLSGSKTGVFVGITGSDYYEILAAARATNPYAVTGNLTSVAANRISYTLNLMGPSLSINTACSSSLMAVHLACKSLCSGESSLALAYGVNILLIPEITQSLKNVGLISPTGRCKAFDAQADGFVRSEGAGVVVLKLLSQALADGDRIYALIRGSAINHDGRTTGLGSPNLQAQQTLLREAYQNAGIAPSAVQYVEAQGTGTLLGDAIELKALATVLGANRSPKNFCRIGTVKTNIGHLEAASGIAGLIKVALSLKYEQIPPNLHFQKLNPNVSLDKLSLQVQQTLEPWPNDQPRRAGVSAFGFGGTNVHVVMEAAPPKVAQSSQVDRSLHLLALSAKTETALRELAQRYQEFLVNHADVSIADVCFSANTGRSSFNHRLTVTADSTIQLAERLEAFALCGQSTGLVNSYVKPKKVPKIGFLFSGLIYNTLEVNQLYKQAPTFRQVIDRCNVIAQPLLGKSLVDILCPTTTQENATNEIENCTALFALQIALCELWKSWGIEPDVVMGISIGELAAACIAGMFSLEDALKLIISFQSYIQSQPCTGTIVGVFAEEAQVADAIQPYSDKVAIGLLGGKLIAISGEQQAVDVVTTALTAKGIKTVRWHTSYAYHSPLMKLLPRTEALQSAKIPIVSCITGQLSPDEMMTREYWMNMLCKPVRYATGIQTMYEQEVTVFVEIGPKCGLSSIGIHTLAEEFGVWLPSLRSGQSDWQQLLSSLAQLYIMGAPVNWSGFDSDYSRERLQLPTYPFERQSYWFSSSSLPKPTALSPPSQQSFISTLFNHALRVVRK